MMTQMISQADNELLSVEAAARLLLCSPRWIRELERAGWFARVDGRHFRLADVVRGYLRFRDDANRRAQKSAGDSWIKNARAREIELRNLACVDELIAADEVRQMIEAMLALFADTLATLPGRCPAELRPRLESEGAAIMRRVAGIAKARLGELRGVGGHG